MPVLRGGRPTQTAALISVSRRGRPPGGYLAYHDSLLANTPLARCWGLLELCELPARGVHNWSARMAGYRPTVQGDE